MDVRRAVDILASDREPQFDLERELAVLAFSGWLNWPGQPYASTNLVFLGINHALVSWQSQGKMANDQWLAQFLEPHRYLEQLQKSILVVPEFFLISDELGFDETRYTADIVRFLLTFKPRSKDKRSKASLGKAMAFINRKGGFPGSGNIKRRTREYSDSQHQEIWKVFKKTAAFQFVRYYASEVDWLFDPADPQLMSRVAEMAAKRDRVKAFFARSVWVQARLAEILDRRSMAPEDFFTFPESVEPEPCPLPRIPRGVHAAMSDYRRSRSESNFRDIEDTEM